VILTSCQKSEALVESAANRGVLKRCGALMPLTYLNTPVVSLLEAFWQHCEAYIG